MKILSEQIRCAVAESPLWDDKNNKLLFVDILGKCVFIFNYLTGEFIKYDVGQQVGCIALCDNDNILLAMEDGIYIMTPDGEQRLAHQPVQIKGRRFNDGKVGPDGCFYVGTTDYDGNGAFYRLKNGVLEELFDGCGCSNGIDWSSDGKKMFYCDTALQKIEVFDFDIKTHGLSNRRTVSLIDKNIGMPDGFAMDSNDDIWLGLWNGNAIIQVKKDGSIGERIDVPAKKVSSCCFAGEHLTDLVITTASKDDEVTYPLSGSLFSKKMNVKGKKSFRFIENGDD